MKKKPYRWKPKRVLRLPDLDHAQTAVLDSLGSPGSERSYRFAIDDFIAWYCSEPRLAFNKTVVLRYRLQLEARRLSASTINVRLAAVRRLAYEAADGGLLSPELAASIRRVRDKELHFLVDAVIESTPSQNLNAKSAGLLTKQEKGVVRLVAEGLKNRDIARQLNLSENTVRNYMFRIFDKLGTSNRVELALYAVRQQI